jgi:hypothetical protein
VVGCQGSKATAQDPLLFAGGKLGLLLAWLLSISLGSCSDSRSKEGVSKMQRLKCLICETKPRSHGAYCHNCAAKIKAEEARRIKPKPDKYLHYRGQWVGLYTDGVDEEGDRQFKPKYMGYSPIPEPGAKDQIGRQLRPKYPMGKTLNLDVYLPGYTREQVKRMKAVVLKLSAIH